jgi:anthranilate phosphoribosyltransferase
MPLIWRGQDQDEYAEAAIIGTAAIALRLIGKATSPGDALQQATKMWQTRDKSRH